MKSLYWIGIKESDLDDAENTFEKSVTFFGNNTEKNLSFSASTGKRVNHNLDNNATNEFFTSFIQQTIENDPDANFMYFSPYHAYYLSEDVRSRILCKNDKVVLELLRSKINARFWVANSVPILPSVLIGPEQCSYEKVCDLFNHQTNRYVIQKNYSAGGYSTFLLDDNVHLQWSDNSLLMASPYVEEAIPINITAIIYKEDIILFPASIQIIIEDSQRLLYKGADFISYQEIDESIRQQILNHAKKICENLQRIGYYGICGIDFISDGRNVYFMEINERFQASSYLINISLREQGLPSLQELCIHSFSQSKCCVNLSAFSVNYSNYIYTYHERYKHCYFYLFEKARHNTNVVRIIDDGFSKDKYYEEDAYLFTLVFNVNITSSSCFDGVHIDDHVREHEQLYPSDVLKVKFGLLNMGFDMTKSAEDYFKNNGGVRIAINTGLDLVVFDSIRVCSICNKARLLTLTPFELKHNVQNGLYLTHYGKKISTVQYDKPDSLSDRCIDNGTPYSYVAFLANGRLQINHESICFYKEHAISCKFCGLPNQPRYFTLQDAFEVIDTYLKQDNFKNFLIGGASNSYDKGWDNIVKIASYISGRSPKPIYLMSPPPPQKEILYQLKDSGITEVSFNIEIFDRQLAKKIMPGKGTIPIDIYYTMLEESTKIWGKNGCVRSMIIVGLESKQTLLRGVESLAVRGIQPILSPFGPRQDTELKDAIPFSTEELIEIFSKADCICRKYGLKPGPDNLECQNNTLSIPDNYRI